MEHDDIVAWVNAHPEVLSADLDAISQYPVPFRKVIMTMVSDDQRLALWQEHVTIASAADATLTEEQRTFVAETVAALPGILSSEPVYKNWAERTRATLTRDQEVAIFWTLGPAEPPGGLPLPPDAIVKAPA